MAGRALLLVLALVAHGAGLAAQVPDSLDPRERPLPAPAPADTTDSLTAGEGPGAIQPMPHRLRWTLAVSRGTLGTLQSQPIRVTENVWAGRFPGPFRVPKGDETGLPAPGSGDSTTVQRSMEAEGGARVSGGVVLSLSPAWAVRMDASWARTTLRARYGGDSASIEALRYLADRNGADLTVLALESALQLRIPTATRLQPYVEAGAGGLHARSSGTIPGDGGLPNGVTRLMGLAGAGALLPVNDWLAVEGRATVRAFRTPADPVPPGTSGSSTVLVSTRFTPVPTDLYADRARELVTVIRFQLGISAGFGARLERPDPPAPEPPSAPPGR